MGFGKLTVVIALCLSINALLCLGRKKPGTDILYECVWSQSCKCKKPDRFVSCYKYLTETSQRWIVDQFNACCPVELEYGVDGLGLQNVCSIDDKEFKRCSDEFLSHFKKRYAEAAIGLHGPDESPAFEKGRACLEAIVSFCESNPDGCMR
ncbi:hypothetical protein AVEN_130644-1 [Araneus ventricosus]|uniref:DUF19 domain-containing protein n=1 Tax=Araneus ventricosus TaxID=182803 RepID=A0A4Y2U9I8_ARAVE|nr:hypothetical protein AVEN_130644-1 [Araneus ventricosus]